MHKPHWECLHDWKIEDINFELKQIYKLKLLLRRHPDDRIGEMLRDLIKTCKNCLTGAVKRYEKVYGDKPNVAKMRKEIEGDNND